MALKTISARGQMHAGMAIHVQCGTQTLTMDQPVNAGGRGLGPSPLEAVLAAVAGCFGTIGRFIAHQQKIELRGMTFEIEADYDPDGLMGRNDKVRPGFQCVRLKIAIDADLDLDQKQAFLELIEKRCPVADNLVSGTRFKSELV